MFSYPLYTVESSDNLFVLGVILFYFNTNKYVHGFSSIQETANIDGKPIIWSVEQPILYFDKPKESQVQILTFHNIAY